MNDTALIITARSRPEYLARTLESWAAVEEISQLNRVIIALGDSDEVNLQAWMILQWSKRVAPCPVLIKHDDPGWPEVTGEHRALGDAIERAVEYSPGVGYVICSAEDVTVSDDVLRYIAWARRFPEAAWVCAHNEIGQGWHQWYDDANADQHLAKLGHYFNPWCWSFTANVWRDIIRPAWDWDATSGDDDAERGWDWQMHRLSAVYKAVSPDASRACNIGELGGVYAIPDHYPMTVARSFQPVRGHTYYYRSDA